MAQSRCREEGGTGREGGKNVALQSIRNSVLPHVLWILYKVQRTIPTRLTHLVETPPPSASLKQSQKGDLDSTWPSPGGNSEFNPSFRSWSLRNSHPPSLNLRFVVSGNGHDVCQISSMWQEPNCDQGRVPPCGTSKLLITAGRESYDGVTE